MKKMTLIATGDAFITRRFPEGGYEGFEQVRDVISQYDVKFSNLEMTFHNEEGYPAAFSGGTWNGWWTERGIGRKTGIKSAAI